MRILIALLCLLSLATPSFAVYAQTDTSQHTIRVFAGSDTTPPTTPTLISADPISQTQIDLAWTASTDNFILSGYVVYRDGSPLATTTLTTYSDGGLTASTTYTYAVRAFDNVFNYSSSSNSLSATTPDNPPPPEETDEPQSTAARVVVENVTIIPGVSTSTFIIDSALPARFEIKWGRTASYELGQISSDVLRRSYTTVITDLEPGTRYEYEIIGYTPHGASNVVKRGQFTTLEDPDLIAPANVNRFQALTEGDDVRLTWRLPTDFDIAYVRIVRSHLFYPENPNDGAIVYQGTGAEAIDRGVLSQYSPAYYTAFVYDTSGNVSSGAITLAYAEIGAVSPSDIPNAGVGTGPDDGDEVIATSTTELEMPDIFEILITQKDIEYSFADTKISLRKSEAFTISLKADAVSKNLKSIIVTLQDPTDQRQSFSFLLRLNKNQSAYEAVIAPLEVEGTSVVNLSIYDFSVMRVADYTTKLRFVADDVEILSPEEIKQNDTQLFWQFLVTIFLLSSSLVWWLLAKRRKGDEDNKDADQ